MKAPSYKSYMLTLLLVILASNFVERMALGLAMQEIKTELHLSDTQLGFLTGIAFALFYSVMGIPIARWADRGNRVTIISLTAFLWSIAVALCGVATSFAQLLVIRIGAAVGEAGCIPPAHSLIADHFTRAERPRAVARYMLGASFSVVLGYLVAGWLNELFGWRIMFALLGLPGVVLAALAWLTLREPRFAKARHVESAPLSCPSHAVATMPPPSFREVCVTLWANRTFRHLLFCFSVSSFFGYGIMQWQPAFFIRSYGFGTGELGTWFAAIYGVGGVLGTYLGGEWVGRRAVNNEALQLKAMAIVSYVSGGLSALVYLGSNEYVAFGWLALSVVLATMISGPLFATIQTVVPERMRAMSIALLYLFANLVGMGLGPLLTGALSDALRPAFGEESLRYVLLALCPGSLWAAWHMGRAGLTVRRDLAASQATQDEEAGTGSAEVDPSARTYAA